jgi:Transaldolase/Fructose-6-phosphate aldolase
MTGGLEFWWDSAPELIERERDGWDGAGPFGPFRGVTTNPMLLLAACEQLPSHGRHGGDGWDLYLACAARSAGFLADRGLSIPFCVQLDPRSAFDAEAMLGQAAEILDRIPTATIKVPLTSAGLGVMHALASAGTPFNATWGFSVAQLVAAARVLADAIRARPATAPRARYVLTLMEGRLGDLGLHEELGGDSRLVRAAECVVFEAAYESLRPYRDVATLLASSLRTGPDEGCCWHYGSKAGKDVILTLPPPFLREQGLPSSSVDYGRVDDAALHAVLGSELVRRYAAEDGFRPHEFDRLPPMTKTRAEVTRAIESFEELALEWTASTSSRTSTTSTTPTAPITAS